MGAVENHAHRAGVLRHGRVGHRAQFRCQHLQVGGEYLQGDAGGGVRSVMRGVVLEGSHDTGSPLGDWRRFSFVD